MGDLPGAGPQDGPPQDPVSLRLIDAQATQALGRQLARWLLAAQRPGEAALLLLQGDLGAGKTCLVQGLAEALGIDEPITSPTFALAHHYAGQRQGQATALVHLDLYRLEQAFSADELFAEEEEQARSLTALLAIEWPQRLSALPAEAWRVELELVDPQRPEAGRLATIRLPEGRR
ncbi:MAG: tRNA (adenosine(37)-N6)-threonylcarbamoyltransferase complex ATPase subunit type 1 TsaE [Cyanobium sp.]